MAKPTLRVTIAPTTLALVAGALLAFKALEAYATLICLFWISVIAATALRPLVDYFVERRFPRALGVIVVLSGLGGLLVLLGVLVVPVLLEQAQALSLNLPRYAAQLPSSLEALRGLHGRFPAVPELSRLSAQFATWVAARLAGWLQVGIGWTLQFFSLLTGLLAIGFTTLFLLIDGERIARGALRVLPARVRPMVEGQFEPVSQRLGAYVRGQLMSMGALAVMLMIGLSAMRLPYAWLLAILSGLFEIVPWLGTIAGITLASLVALTVSWKLMLLVWLVYAVANFVQGNVLGPVIMARTVSVPPVPVIYALLIGSQAMGLLGAVVAVPTLAVVLVLVENLWVPRMDAAQDPAPAQVAPETAP